MWRRGRKKINGRQWVSGVFLLSWITCSPSLCLAECGDPVKFKAATAARWLETITELQSRFAPWRAEQKGPLALNSISVSQQPLSRPRSITHTLPQHHCTTGPSRSQRESKREGIDLEHGLKYTTPHTINKYVMKIKIKSTISTVCLKLRLQWLFSNTHNDNSWSFYCRTWSLLKHTLLVSRSEHVNGSGA